MLSYIYLLCVALVIDTTQNQVNKLIWSLSWGFGLNELLFALDPSSSPHKENNGPKKEFAMPLISLKENQHDSFGYLWEMNEHFGFSNAACSVSAAVSSGRKSSLGRLADSSVEPSSTEKASIGRWIWQKCPPDSSSPPLAETKVDHISPWLYFCSPWGTTVWSSSNSENFAAVWVSSIVSRRREKSVHLVVVAGRGQHKTVEWYREKLWFTVVVS